MPQLTLGAVHIVRCKEGEGRGFAFALRTTLYKCDVTYVVSPAYKGGGGGQKVLKFCVHTK